jgi:metal transporter CNNM
LKLTANICCVDFVAIPLFLNRLWVIGLVCLSVSVVSGGEIVEAVYEHDTDTIHLNGGLYRREVSLAGDNSYAVNLFFTVICVIAAALASGLTMGLVSIDPFDMQIILEASESDCATDAEREELRREKSLAKRIYPLVSRHHQLLVTLLLLNSIANEALPLFLDQIVSPYAAVVISVSLVLVLGEVVPSAIFTGPNQLPIAAAFSGVVWFLIYAFWAVAYPLSVLLDRLLGEEHKGRYNKAEFRALLNIHNDQAAEDEQREINGDKGEGGHGLHGTHSHGGQHGEGGDHGTMITSSSTLATRHLLSRSGIAKRELTIMQGALELYRLKCKDVMVPLDEVYMLSKSQMLDQNTLDEIMARGHSRIPVYQDHPHNIRGMLLVKTLIVLNPEDAKEVGSLDILEPIIAHTESTLLDLLYEFTEGKSHLAVVVSDPERVAEAFRTGKQIPVSVHMAGIITLEDVIEKLINHEINDESDVSWKFPSNRIAHSATSAPANNSGLSTPPLIDAPMTSNSLTQPLLAPQ